jgi:hypothetical protein
MASRRVQAGRKPWAAADYQIGVPVPGPLNAASAALFRTLKRLCYPVCRFGTDSGTESKK